MFITGPDGIPKVFRQLSPTPANTQEAPQESKVPVSNGETRNLTDNFAASLRKRQLQDAFVGGGLPTKYTPPTNLPAQTFTDDEGVPPPSDPVYRTSGPNQDTFVVPEEYAKYIKYGLHDDATRSSHFLQALRDHKDDTAWTQKFFQSIGTKETARLTKQASIWVPDNKSSQPIADALAGLTRDGKLTQGDADNLVRNMAGFPNATFTDVDGVFAALGNSPEGTKLKNMFSTSAMSLATGQGSFVDGNYSDYIRSTFAALGTRTLASTWSSNQLTQLNEWRKNFGDDAVSSLFRSSMSAGPLSPNDADTGRVATLLKTISTAGPHYEGSQLSTPIIPQSELDALGTAAFKGATLAMSDDRVAGDYLGNVEFKNAMSNIFMSDFDSIVKSGLTPNSARFDPAFNTGMGKFMQTALFAHSPDDTSKALAQFLTTKFAGLKQGLLSTAPDADAAFGRQFGGLNREDGAALAGSMIGWMSQGIRAANDQLDKDAATKAEAVSLVVNIGLSWVPSAGGKLAEGITKEYVKKMLQGSSDALQNKITDQLKSGAVSEAKKSLRDALQNKDLAQSLVGTYYAFDGQLPNETKGDSANLLAQFETAYQAVVHQMPKDLSASTS